MDYIKLSSHFHFKETLVKARVVSVNPVYKVGSWQVLEDIEELKVNPLIEISPLGRHPQ